MLNVKHNLSVGATFNIILMCSFKSCCDKIVMLGSVHSHLYKRDLTSYLSTLLSCKDQLARVDVVLLLQGSKYVTRL